MAVAMKSNLLVCTQLECEATEEMQASIEQAKVEGADLVELCIDSVKFSHISQVDKLIQHTALPAIVSYRYLAHPSFFFIFPEVELSEPNRGLYNTQVINTSRL